MRVSWRWETRVKGVMFGRWRWARRMVAVAVIPSCERRIASWSGGNGIVRSHCMLARPIAFVVGWILLNPRSGDSSSNDVRSCDFCGLD